MSSFYLAGIGVAWTLAAIVNAVRGQPFRMEVGNLAFSLTVFCVFALTAIALLVLRRSRSIGMLKTEAIYYYHTKLVFMLKT